MTDLFDISEQRLKGAIETVAADIGNARLSKKKLFETMEGLHGCTSANGTWTQRDAYDLLEAGLALHLTRLGPVERTDISSISDLVDSLPTQTVRSEDQIRFQQFSTPADLAALAMIAAQPRSGDIVLEPSAGHGSLVSMLPSVEELHLNELDLRRREKLKLLFAGATITGFDGAMLTSLAAPELRPTLILMNPPFSRSQGRGVDEYAAARHCVLRRGRDCAALLWPAPPAARHRRSPHSGRGVHLHRCPGLGVGQAEECRRRRLAVPGDGRCGVGGLPRSPPSPPSRLPCRRPRKGCLPGRGGVPDRSSIPSRMCAGAACFPSRSDR